MEICPTCSNFFKQKPPSQRRICCSVQCANILKKGKEVPSRKTGVIKRCMQCTKEIYVVNCKIKRKSFCNRECQYKYLKNKNSWGFKKNNTSTKNNPYKRIFKNGKYIKEHRLIMENHIGRILKKEEYIHHINGDHSDNRIENLQIVSNSYHGHIHKSKN